MRDVFFSSAGEVPNEASVASLAPKPRRHKGPGDDASLAHSRQNFPALPGGFATRAGATATRRVACRRSQRCRGYFRKNPIRGFSLTVPPAGARVTTKKDFFATAGNAGSADGQRSAKMAAPAVARPAPGERRSEASGEAGTQGPRCHPARSGKPGTSHPHAGQGTDGIGTLVPSEKRK